MVIYPSVSYIETFFYPNYYSPGLWFGVLITYFTNILGFDDKSRAFHEKFDRKRPDHLEKYAYCANVAKHLYTLYAYHNYVQILH